MEDLFKVDLEQINTHSINTVLLEGIGFMIDALRGETFTYASYAQPAYTEHV